MWSCGEGDSGLFGMMVGPCSFHDGQVYLSEISTELYAYLSSFKCHITQNLGDLAGAIFS